MSEPCEHLRNFVRMYGDSGVVLSTDEGSQVSVWCSKCQRWLQIIARDGMTTDDVLMMIANEGKDDDVAVYEGAQSEPVEHCSERGYPHDHAICRNEDRREG